MPHTYDPGRPEMPFSAVIGQARFKLALVLVAIDPAIGGVVISGPRGSAKSTLARGLAALVAPHHTGSPADSGQDTKAISRFVTLPLGASEEMVTGTLNLEKVLNEKQLAFSPGLLSKAHNGVLYVDEVNLLPDNLVDLLLDVAASGVNYIERDGISHQHAADFVLVGTMNPDEGELRTQLLDRFGLSVVLNNRYQVAERVAIVKAREAFDANPQAFVLDYAERQRALIARIAAAKDRLKSVVCSESARVAIAERCEQAAVDGLRADIVWHRAALAHAAWEGRSEVMCEDIEAVAELVLNHRRRQSSSSPPSHPGAKKNQATAEQKPFGNGFERPDDSHRQNASGDSEESDWGSMEPMRRPGILAPKTEIPTRSVIHDTNRKPVLPETLFAPCRGQSASGRQVANIRGRLPDWFASLLGSRGQWPPENLVMRKRKLGQSTLHIVLVDTSGSTLQGDVFSRAKGVVAAIAKKAYLSREQLAVFGFGNDQVMSLMAKIRAPKHIETWLERLTAGGGTPLLKAINEVSDYGAGMHRKYPALDLRIYIVSDGRSREILGPVHLPGECIWVDIEQAPIPRGRGRVFASQLGALYISLRQLVSFDTQTPGWTV
ncbi:MAG: magnesium chelatase [Gammaproteobacteria bacterium]|nr:MAG: magnesium chelatase [Gammaproteobacteria bacterium]